MSLRYFRNRFSITGIFLICSALILLGLITVSSVKYFGNKVAVLKEGETISWQVDSTEHTRRLTNYFDRLHRINVFNGTVLVARHDTIIFHRNYGWADMIRKTPITDSTAFQLASVSKPITATAVLQLVEKGKIDLDSPVKYYLPGFPYENITVKHLLQHSSGLTDYLKVPSETFPFPDSLMSNANVLYWLKEVKPHPAFKPGARFMYCNTNYALLALIVERVSGKTYSRYLQQYIFGPLEMRETGLVSELPDYAFAYGHTFGGKWVANDHYDQVYGDKGIGTTALDLFKFSRGWFEGKVIKKTTAVMAQSDSIYARKAKRYYTLGWRMAYDENDRKVIYHNGWWHGYKTAFHRRMEDEITVIILSNKLSNATYRAVQSAFDILDDMDPEARKLFEED